MSHPRRDSAPSGRWGGKNPSREAGKAGQDTGEKDSAEKEEGHRRADDHQTRLVYTVEF